MTDTDTSTGITLDDFYRLKKQVYAEVDAELAAAKAQDEQADREIALDLLTESLGRERALEELYLNAEAHREELAPMIAERKAALAEAAEEQARIERENSPEGRKQAALAAEKAVRERAALASAARTLLVNEGQPADIVESITDSEALALAGIERDPRQEAEEAEMRRLSDPAEQAKDERSRQIETLTTKWFQMAPYERRAAAQELLGDDADAFIQQQSRRTHPFLPIYDDE